VAGFGVEHKLSQQWSFKGEFLYYDLGRSNASLNGAGESYSTQFTHEIMVGQMGLEFHF
jgi:opacity protein-like surface antigen